MKHIKTYENWFTNLFKNSDNYFQDYADDVMGSKLSKNYNGLMGAAAEGNWGRFKTNFTRYFKHINDINIEHNDDNTTSEMSLLMHIVLGEGGLWEKKKMLKKTLDESKIDYTFKNENGKTFYDLIKEPKLKKWFDETYPNIVVELDSIKYNL